MSLFGKWFGFARDEIFDEGIAAFDRGAFDEAIEAFEACLSDDPDPNLSRLARFYWAESHLHLAHRHMLSGNPSAALDDYQSALEIHSGSAEVHLFAARACQALGNLDGAAWYARKAHDLNGANVDALIFQAQMGMERGDLTHAADALAQAAQVARDGANGGDPVGPENESLRRQIDGMAQRYSSDLVFLSKTAEDSMRESRFLEAIHTYERAISIAPQQSELRLGLAEALIAAGRSDEAYPQLVAANHLGSPVDSVLARENGSISPSETEPPTSPRKAHGYVV